MFKKECEHKFGTVQKDGYQYCEKCGKAILAPCKHDWKAHSSYTLVQWGSVATGRILVYECQKCKAIRKESIGG